ncbi:Translationally-controlled tumor protein [Manis javanica]|nr:Translationally-controlled tumor protein [Manis javanica]
MRCFPTSTRSGRSPAGCAWRWRGSMVSRTEGSTDYLLTGGNASAEGPEGAESREIADVNIVMNHHLQEGSFTKEAHTNTSKILCSQSKANLKNGD